MLRVVLLVCMGLMLVVMFGCGCVLVMDVVVECGLMGCCVV